MRSTILLALGLALTACAGEGTDQAQNDHDQDHDSDSSRPHPEMRAAEGGDEGGDAETVIRGIVRVVGNDPNPQVALHVGEGAEATQIAIVGELRDELGGMSGVEVSITGSDAANPQGMPEQAIDVSAYDVISVNSAPAYLGVLELRDGEMWLDRDDDLRLITLPAQLQDMAGAKVWLVGPVDGDELRVQSYGIVRGR
jgi:hypothetical protein